MTSGIGRADNIAGRGGEDILEEAIGRAQKRQGLLWTQKMRTGEGRRYKTSKKCWMKKRDYTVYKVHCTTSMKYCWRSKRGFIKGRRCFRAIRILIANR